MTFSSKSLCAALAMTFAASSAVPVMAAPAFSPAAPTASAEVIQVQARRENRRERRFERRQDRRDNRFERRQDRRDARLERRGNAYYYNGRRGYRSQRPGYRQYNGYWFPAAAFIAGAIIGGATSGASSGGGSHVSWCQNRWRSYRVSDNSYQPYNGPRQLCVSPYR